MASMVRDGLAYDPASLGLDVVKMTGEEALVFCPYHGDNNASAEYNIPLGLFYCFTCQTSKNASQLAEDLGGTLVAVGEVLELYRAFRGHETDWLALTRNPPARDNDYLNSRDFPPERAQLYGLLENEDGIIFPIKNKFDTVVGVQIRHYTRQPKYLFYGSRQPIWPMARQTFRGPLFITEGVFGTLRAEQNMVPAAAMMGASSVKGTAEFLWNCAHLNPYVVMDRDYAGYLAAGKFVLHGIPAILWPLNWTDNPDEMTELEWVEIRDRRDEFATLDVNEVIARCSNPVRLQKTLMKYYRRMK